MNFWKKLVSLTLACVLGLGLLAGCGNGTTTPPAGGSADPGANPNEDKMFNVALTAPFTGFDPLRTNDSASTYVNVQIYETLYRIDPVTGEFNCLLAAELPTFSDDGLL